MGAPRNFEIDKNPATLSGVAFSERRPKGAGGGVATKTDKLKLRLDVFDPERHAKVLCFFPGSDAMAREIAKEETHGCEIRSQRKLGDVLIKVFDVTGSLLFEGTGAKGEQPRMYIGERAKTTTMEILVEVALPTEKSRTLKDYYRADVLVSVANAQKEMEPTGADPSTPKRTGGKGGKKNNLPPPDNADGSHSYEAITGEKGKK